MRVYITGIKGQLGKTLARQWSSRVEIIGSDLPEIDITDPSAITGDILAAKPDVVVHCAALTDVDGCARNPELAYRVNGLGAQNVAIAAQQAGAALVHISTNEVFSGLWDDGQARAYREFDRIDPINPYGASKAAGEWYASHLLNRFFIVRTAWLYTHGGVNFIHAIRRAVEKGVELRVVSDEVGNPTFAPDLADGIIKLVETGRYGIYHLTNSGACSRYSFAAKILELSGLAGTPITPIVQAQWPRPSRPPAYAPLENVCAAALGITLRPWQEALADYLRGEDSA